MTCAWAVVCRAGSVCVSCVPVACVGALCGLWSGVSVVVSLNPDLQILSMFASLLAGARGELAAAQAQGQGGPCFVSPERSSWTGAYGAHRHQD